MKNWFSRRPLPPAAPAALAATGSRADALSIAEALILEGQTLEDEGALEPALQRYQRAIDLQPTLPSAWLNHGNALQSQGHIAKALESYRRALSLDESGASSWLNMGNALIKLPAYTTEEHVAAVAESEKAYRAAIAIRPEWAEAWFGLGCALEVGLAADEACAAYRQTLELDPNHERARFNLDDLMVGQLVKRRQIASARRLLLEALSRFPKQRRLVSRLADLERDSGRLSEGLAYLKQLVDQQPDDFAVHSVYLFSMNYVIELSARDIYEAHRRFGQMMEERIGTVKTSFSRAPKRRLRIGYVSPDFYQHAVAAFMIPVLRQHNRERVEVICYHLHQGGDHLTAQLRTSSDVWRDVAKLSDDAVAQQVIDDRVDVLIDLAGHTGDGRLSLFARRVAPIQMTWLGYIGTTGLTRMDYRICDGHTDPQGQAESWHSEKLLRMPDTQWCYEPQLPVPEPGPLPYLSLGHWTFGSYNNALKLNPSIFSTWAAVLRLFPRSRLKLFSIENEEIHRWALSNLTKHGITADRVDLVPRLTMNEYFASSKDVDVALDSFPYTGGTTTCDSLMMGLPVVTIAGRRSIERSGVSLLHAVGLQDWIAPSMDALPTLLTARLSDVAALATLRSTLPRRMRESPLMNARRFVAGLEDHFEAAWQSWAKSEQ